MNVLRNIFNISHAYVHQRGVLWCKNIDIWDYTSCGQICHAINLHIIASSFYLRTMSANFFVKNNSCVTAACTTREHCSIRLQF